MKLEDLKELPHLYSVELMRRVEAVRDSDLEEEQRLCKELLQVAERDGDVYCATFANVYLLDSALALGNYEECAFYLLRAELLCRENSYPDLSIPFSNFAGLYYGELEDEQSALNYYFNGLGLARAYGDYSSESKLLSNLGTAFTARGGLEQAREYYSMAFKVIEPHLHERCGRVAVSYLSNFAEICQRMGDFQASKRALERCEGLGPHSIYHSYRLKSAWCCHYAASGRREAFMAGVEELLDMGFAEFGNTYFVSGELVTLCRYMLDMEAQEKAKRLLDVLERICPEGSLGNRNQLQMLKVRYYERFGSRAEQDAAYRGYYALEEKVTELGHRARAQSILAKIGLTNALLERERIDRENRALESATQLDELTGLFNRRYFSKLLSKVVQTQSVRRLGVIMLDIDYFKQFNDFYGHVQGDAALKCVADSLRWREYVGLFPGRYGGDEFICLCVNMADEVVEEYLAGLCRTLAEQEIPHERSGCAETLTVSVGWCNEVMENVQGGDKLIKLADSALYETKQVGRNSCTRKRF